MPVAYSTMIDSSAIPSPLEAISTYFHDASSAASVRSIATSSAETIVVSSTATHSVPKSAASGTSSMLQPEEVQQREVAPREPGEAGALLLDS